MIGYYRASKQQYFKTIDIKDDIMVGDYVKDDGCNWEFQIVEVDFKEHGKTIQANIYADAFKGLTPEVVETLKQLKNCKSLNQAEKILQQNNIIPVRKDKEEISLEDILKEGQRLATFCQWGGRLICQVFAEALTDANFHSLRKVLVPVINKELNADIVPEG